MIAKLYNFFILTTKESTERHFKNAKHSDDLRFSIA